MNPTRETGKSRSRIGRVAPARSWLFFAIGIGTVPGACLHAQSSGVAPTISQQPASQTVAAAATATFSVSASGTAPLAYQWLREGNAIVGATASTLVVANVQPANAGIYQVMVTNAAGTVTSGIAALGLSSTAKVLGAGTEVGADIVHPSGNIYDQILLQGTAASITADPGQITRISYIDLNDDIVQVEFAGAGTLSLLLNGASGPAAPLKYNQPAVAYMKGHASVVIAGADETTNVSIFSVGRANAVNQALFQSGTTYDGIADVASIAIASANGKFGGIRSANASYFNTRSLTGIHAPGVQFTGPVFVGNINAYESATAELVLGSGADVRVTGGDLFQSNGQAVQLSGVTTLQFADGSTSQGALVAAQPNQARLAQLDALAPVQIAGPIARLFVASLRPETAAAGSLASGFATILLSADGTTATVAASFSNLTTAETSAHLKIGNSGDFVLSLPVGQFSNRTWSFTPVGNYTTADLTNALKAGNISIGLDSTRFPSGELRGNFIPTTGSQTFVAPRPAPALATSALASPSQTDAARFMMQATYGPTTAGINAVMTRGISGWITDQMALPATSWVTELRADVAAFPNPVPPPNIDFAFQQVGNATAAWWKTAVTAPDQLRQRVAFALSEIFVVGDLCAINAEPEAKAKYYDILVQGAFGNYRQLLENVTLSPVMGTWLSHLSNMKADPVRGTSPDENYAREVQQLFSIGLVQLQPDGSLLLDSAGQPIPTYNQAMVSETAKVFTGWSFALWPPDATDGFGASPPSTSRTIHGDDNAWLVPMRYYDGIHDKTAKSVVSLQQVPPAQASSTVIPANRSGPQDLAIMLDTLTQHPNTGPFIGRQLIQRLVTSNPSPGYVYRVAQVFANDGTGTRGNLGAVVRAILTDYEARSPELIGNVGYGKVKETLLRVTALLRALKVAAPNGRYLNSWFGDPRHGSGYYPAGTIAEPNVYLAQEPLFAPTVFNFFAPDFSPPGAMAAAGLVAPEMQIIDGYYSIRIPNQLTKLMLPGGDVPATLPSPSPLIAMNYSDLLPLAQNAPALVDQVDLLFCARQMTAGTRTQILSALQSIASASDLHRVETAVVLTIVSPDAAVQK